LIESKVDLIMAILDEAAFVAKGATTTIPILLSGLFVTFSGIQH
jgi:hypothetical protein